MIVPGGYHRLDFWLGRDPDDGDADHVRVWPVIPRIGETVDLWISRKPLRVATGVVGSVIHAEDSHGPRWQDDPQGEKFPSYYGANVVLRDVAYSNGEVPGGGRSD